jgi:hypothetical protein
MPLGVRKFHLERLNQEPTPKKQRIKTFFDGDEERDEVENDEKFDSLKEVDEESTDNSETAQEHVGEQVKNDLFSKNLNIDGYMMNKVHQTDLQFEKDVSTMLSTDKKFFGRVDGHEQYELYVNGQTNPSKEKIRRWMGQYGGRHSDWLRDTTTHYIADAIAATKIVDARKGRFKVVTGKWVEDSVKAGRCLPESDYQLEVLRDHWQPNILETMKQQRSPSSLSSSSSSSSSSSTTTTLATTTTSTNSSPRRGARCSKDDPNFIETFFRHSRLHFIGSFRAHLRRLVRSIRPVIPAPIQGRRRRCIGNCSLLLLHLLFFFFLFFPDDSFIVC